MKRIYYIDCIRIIAILIVFFFHTSHFFDPLYWHVKNPQKSEIALLFLGFVNIWIMPLFFFLSGASGIFGIQKPFASYLKSKVKRLLVPFIMGVVLLIPPQKYVEALSNQTFNGGFFPFLSGYFGGGIFNYPLGFSPVWIGAISYHLWFLGHLLIISVVLYPVMQFFYAKGEWILSAICKSTSFRGGALLMFVPVAIVRIVLKKHFPDYTGWCDLAMYACFFLWGFFYTRHDGLKQTLFKSRYAALAAGTILFMLYIASFPLKNTLFGQLFQNNKVYGFYMFQEAAGALTTWCWIIFITAMGMTFLNHDSKYRQPLNEAVLPFYILHQTVLLLIGFVVVQWNWSILGKFGFIAASALFSIAVIYLLAIKPFHAIRWLFGMNKKKAE
jgi:fucose 4-O-acetylase-like acetyltransferase